MPPRSPVPQEVSAQLQRVVRRWQQLPLGHALSCMPLVRLLLDDLGGGAVPDLGPAAVMDQLTVLVYDVCDACEAGSVDPPDLATRLVDLRHALS